MSQINAKSLYNCIYQGDIINYKGKTFFSIFFPKFPIETQDMFKTRLLLNPGEGQRIFESGSH